MNQLLPVSPPPPLLAASPAGRPRRIAFYLHDLSGGGVERMRLGLIGALRAAGCEVSLLLHAAGGPLADLLPPDLPRHCFATPRTSADIRPLAAYLRAARPDVLVASLDHNNIAALLARALCPGPTRVVVCQHNALSAEAASMGWKYRAVPLAYRLLAPLAARFVAVSEGVAEDLAAAAGLRRERISVIHNPVLEADFAARAAAPAPHPWFREPLPVIVTAGRLVAQKDHATLLHALAHLRRRLPARLIILGEGPLHEALRRHAAALGLGPHVDLPGFVANPLPFFREAAAFALASRHEGFGNVLVEALGCGTPVVATDCPHGPAEILRRGAFGRLVAPGDAAALADALFQTLQAPPHPAMLRARARDFTAARNRDAWLDLFGALA